MPTPEIRHERRVAVRLRWGLPLLIGLAFVALSVFWSSRIYMAQERARETIRWRRASAVTCSVDTSLYSKGSRR